jgi:hypothetical protein
MTCGSEQRKKFNAIFHRQVINEMMIRGVGALRMGTG